MVYSSWVEVQVLRPPWVATIPATAASIAMAVLDTIGSKFPTFGARNATMRMVAAIGSVSSSGIGPAPPLAQRSHQQ